MRHIRTAAVLLCGFLAAGITLAQGPELARSTEPAAMRVVATELESPWEVAYGPDGNLWITERVGRRVLRLGPDDGSRQVLATIPEVYQSILQDGLLGLAFHPDFLQGRGGDYVYVSFTYRDAGATATRLAVRRYRYDASAPALVEPVDILRDLPSHDDHIGGRLAVGPDRRLYLGIGDLGANFGRNRCMRNTAQELPTDAQVRVRDWSRYTGKILRLDLDGGIPDDNPVIAGVRSHVFSYGHRNPLGLAFGRGGLLYASEHGPETDDELNLIEGGRNYGWPLVAGFRDDKVYVFANWSASAPEPCASLGGGAAIPASVPTQAETAWNDPLFTPPLRTFFTFDSAADARQAGGGTIAPGGLGFHPASGAPGWGDSLPVLGMLKGVVYRVALGPDGRSVEDPPVEIFRTTNRYRDIAVHPNGRTFYLATDPTGRTSDEAGRPTNALANPGSVLQFDVR